MESVLNRASVLACPMAVLTKKVKPSKTNAIHGNVNTLFNTL